MGADLLLATLVHDKDKKLDWTKGRQVARKLPIDVVQRALVDVNGDECDSAKEARAELNDIITALKAELKGGGRDEYVFEMGGKVLHLRGGTSYGDDPSDGFTVFSNAGYFPQVLRAIGFDIEVDQHTQVDEWVAANGEEVLVGFTVPVQARVNLKTATVERVEICSEEVTLEGSVHTATDFKPVEDDDVVRWATEIADSLDIEWPAWGHV